jgi:hypothetical protein
MSLRMCDKEAGVFFMCPGKRRICIDQMGVRIEICLQIEGLPILVKTAKIERDRALCQKQFIDRKGSAKRDR